MKVPAENSNARPILSSVAKEVSLSAKKVRTATIGDDNAKKIKYNFAFESSMLICFKKEERPKAAGPYEA